MIVYVDVLIIVSFYINYLLLRAAAVIVHKPVKRGRVIAGALIGSLSALIIFLPEMGNLTVLIVRVISAVIMVAVSYNVDGIKELYKCSLLFFFVSFIFAGIEYGVAMLLGGNTAIWHNSVFYVNISLLTLVISTTIAYTILWLLRRHFDRVNSADTKYTITVEQSGEIVQIKAIGDTGNNLTDCLSGKPVIICPKASLTKITDSKAVEAMLSCDYIHDSVIPPKGWRLIPFSTINSNGLIPAFSPAKVYIKDEKSIHLVDAYIGVSENDIEYAVFNPKLIAV
ncbi:MAG: sigma-E processing peptidase SpoIIGA [Ruminococcus sp.]|jgi:stage II sporulation protein GA (sporulation sigma-E factor processing peptidase)|nr:sigma-E processing peptidase SpoIIGA [Ruminococcus sp.]